MDDKLYKATREAKKRLAKENPEHYEKVKQIRKKAANNEELVFAERNILNIHDRKLEKLIRSLT